MFNNIIFINFILLFLQFKFIFYIKYVNCVITILLNKSNLVLKKIIFVKNVKLLKVLLY